MYLLYWTNKNSNMPCSAEFNDLLETLRACENMRNHGHKFVTIATDYSGMIGNPGASGAGTEYVPQMLN